MSDTVERLGGSRIQHGPANDRVYLMHLDPADRGDIIERLDVLARGGGYSKIFCKVPGSDAALFTDCGYQLEAEIPAGPGGDGLAFVSRFLTATRARPADARAVATVRERLGADLPPALPPLPAGATLAQAQPAEAEAIAGLYSAVFASYPFPVDDPAFVRESMEAGVCWYRVRDAADRLLAVSSIEPSGTPGAMEMTDFATDPSARGQGLARILLRAMDQAARARGERLGFTIARAGSAGMNLVFARGGYALAGILVNNTQIGGRLESMNVWYKWLQLG